MPPKTQRSTTAMPFQQHKTPQAVVLACCIGSSEARQGNNLKNAWHCNVFFCFFRMHSRPSFFLWHSDMHCIFLEKHAKITHFRRSQRRRIELLSTLRIPTLSGKQVLVEQMCMKKQWWKHITCFVCCQNLAVHLLGITTTCHWSEAIAGGSGYCRVRMKEPLCCLGWLRLKRQFSNGNRLIFDWDGLKTRCSPGTRMLTRMLMVQMSKHMDMQSRRTLFCNSLLEQSCTYFPCYQSAVWSGKCRVWSVEWGEWCV